MSGLEIGGWKQKVKAEAQKQVETEKLEKAKTKLVELYRKRESALQVIRNIDNEIADYEMELSQK